MSFKVTKAENSGYWCKGPVIHCDVCGLDYTNKFELPKYKVTSDVASFKGQTRELYFPSVVACSEKCVNLFILSKL